MNNTYIKYPRTFHLPCSPNATDDDKKLKSDEHFNKFKEVVVTVNPADVNNVIGQRRDNIKNLREIYDVDLIVKADEKIKQGKSKIEITKIYEDF